MISIVNLVWIHVLLGCEAAIKNNLQRFDTEECKEEAAMVKYRFFKLWAVLASICFNALICNDN